MFFVVAKIKQIKQIRIFKDSKNKGFTVYTSLFIVKHESKIIKEKVKQLGNKDYNAHIR